MFYLIFYRGDSSMIPPVPAIGGGAPGRSRWFHWSMEIPLAEQRVEVNGAKLLLW